MLVPNLSSLVANISTSGTRFPTGLNPNANIFSHIIQPDNETNEMITTIEQNLHRDNSRVTPADVDANPNARRANSKREPTFPMKLHALLSDPEAEGVIVWLPHGRSWKIINQDKFESTLLGKHYEHGNMASFMRQVNGWVSIFILCFVSTALA